MIFEIFDVFKWYIVIQIFCVAGFVLGFNLFSPLKYRGFCISKTFGLFIFSIIVWFVCNKKFEILPYSTLTIYLMLLALGGFSYYYFSGIKNNITDFVKENQKYLIYTEIAFLLFFLFFVLLRTYTPNIEGTEKPLEFVVINSLLNTDYLPATDAWLSGHTLNYYYLGQFIFGNVIKLSFVNPSIGFNLINPTVLSLVIVGSFEFIYEITKKVSWGLLSAFMTGLMGNLEPIFQIARIGWNPDTFRWWDAGHVIIFSFPEFPYWSFLHSDVHAHFLVHPFTIMFLFLILSFIKSGNYLITLEDFKNKEKFALNILYCTVLGSFMLINSWNYPPAIALTLAGLFIHCYLNLPKTSTIVNILRIIPPCIFYILTSYGIYLAFYAYYSSPIEGIGIVNELHRTPMLRLIILIGVFLFPVAVLIITEFIRNVILNKDRRIKDKILIIIVLLLVAGIPYILTKSLVIPIMLLIWLYFLVNLLSRKLPSEKAFIYALGFLIFSLILACELIYVNDMFGGTYERQNTVAKSYIQLLLLLPIVVTYIMYIISKNQYLKGTIRRIYIVTIVTLIVLSSSFLWVGTYIKNNKFERVYKEYNWHMPTLNGSTYIATKYDGEYDGIMWLRKHATKNDIVLEAEGKPYSHYGRVASQTGIPSLINWSGSLNVLRGKYFYVTSNPRLEEIKKMFGNPDKQEVYPLFKSSNITYIFIGPLERLDFSPEQLKGFDEEKDLYEKVFSKGNTTIYKVK